MPFKKCVNASILLVSLVSGGQPVLADNSATLMEGDILVKPATTLRSVVDAQIDRAWVNGVVPYRFENGIKFEVQARVMQAIMHWNQQTVVSLTPVEAVSSDLQRDHIVFRAAESCASWVGRQGGQQAIWVGDDCSIGSLVHEIGHAVGLEHEHTRPDRDQHITILWENIAADKQHNFDIPKHRVLTAGDYDHDSIMHYGEYFFSNNGQPTIVSNKIGARMGQRDALSKGDIDAVNAMYGTDVSFISSIQSLGDDTELTIAVSNNGLQVASEIVVSVPVDSALITGQSDNDWQCADHGTGVKCVLDSLAGASTSEFRLTVAGELQPGVEIELSSKAPKPLAANPVQHADFSYADGIQAASAGSLSWLLLALLIPAATRRSKIAYG